VRRTEYVESKRREAWAFGRSQVAGLLEQYRERFRLETAPPPAQVAGELITSVLRCNLTYAPLPLTVFAQTDWLPDETLVTVNSKTRQIEGVKDAKGIQNVAMLHETIHIIRDAPAPTFGQSTLVGFEAPPRFICRRGEQVDNSSAQVEREFWAEEGGRAAAVSYSHLRRVEPFKNLCRYGPRMTNAAAWSCIYEAAEAIFINASALTKQLQHEGYVVIEGKTLRVQPDLSFLMEASV